MKKAEKLLDELKDEFFKLDNRNQILEDENRDLKDDKEELEDSVVEANEIIKLAEGSLLPHNNLDDQNKNKILQNLHANLTISELEKLETFAKEQFKKPNIIYKEVL